MWAKPKFSFYVTLYDPKEGHLLRLVESNRIVMLWNIYLDLQRIRGHFQRSRRTESLQHHKKKELRKNSRNVGLGLQLQTASVTVTAILTFDIFFV